MPANIAFDERTQRYQAFYADKPAWHQLGTVVAGAQTPEQAIELAGTGYAVDMAPAYALIDGQMVEDPAHRATYRTDTNQILGMVTPDYRPIQNLTPMQMLGEIVRTKEAGIVAHAALGRGERLFAVLELARLKDLTIKTDPSRHDGFLVAQWWHDGTGALSIGPYAQRVECQNMANAQLAYAERKGMLVRIAHVGNVGSSLDEARRILGYVDKSIDSYVRTMNELAEIAVSTDWMAEFTDKVIPIPTEMERPVQREHARQLIAQLFEESKTLVGVPKSAYRAFQTVAEYADHFRPVRLGDGVNERRFRSLTEGPAAEIKARALDLLREEFEVRV